ncbi:MAG: hypothetical protein K9G48_09640 [Reyranella sp.]|nr:hypothetical protein [Reyranella sp.]
MSENNKPEGTVATRHDKLTRLVKNSWLFVVVSLATTAIIYASHVVDAVTSIVKAVSPELAKVTMLVTIDDSGDCNFDLPDGNRMRKRSTLDVGINNGSDRNILLTSVTIVPDWVTGDFFAGEIEQFKQYDVNLNDWWTMVQVTKLHRIRETLSDDERKSLGIDAVAQAKEFDDWCRSRFAGACSLGTQGLVEAGRIKKVRDASETWWVKPNPVEIAAIPGNKYVVGKGAVERFRIGLGLDRPVNFLYGTVFLEVRTDSGEALKSGPLGISICNI